jgi:hypothetical protein
MRHWNFRDQAPMQIGSSAHKQMFCRMLLETHNPYKPVRIALVWERIGIAKGIDADGIAYDANFAATGASSVGDALDPRELLELCLAENERRMGGYDARLLRPTTVPRLARFAFRFLKK